jgi:hypothetical protein
MGYSTRTLVLPWFGVLASGDNRLRPRWGLKSTQKPLWLQAPSQRGQAPQADTENRSHPRCCSRHHGLRSTARTQQYQPQCLCRSRLPQHRAGRHAQAGRLACSYPASGPRQKGISEPRSDATAVSPHRVPASSMCLALWRKWVESWRAAWALSVRSLLCNSSS